MIKRTVAANIDAENKANELKKMKQIQTLIDGKETDRQNKIIVMQRLEKEKQEDQAIIEYNKNQTRLEMERL